MLDLEQSNLNISRSVKTESIDQAEVVLKTVKRKMICDFKNNMASFKSKLHVNQS